MGCVIKNSTINNIIEQLKVALKDDNIKDLENIDFTSFIETWQISKGYNTEFYPIDDEGKILEDFIEHCKKNLLESNKVDNKEDNTIPSTIEGENISSKGSDFAKKLTNIYNDLQVEYEGRVFRNAEHAYQTWKSGEFDKEAYASTDAKPKGNKKVDFSTNYQTMVKIITAKLQQHTELIEGINERGGLVYLQKSTHKVTGDEFWETGGENKFIKALIEAYNNAQNNIINSLEDDIKNIVEKPEEQNDNLSKIEELRQRATLAFDPQTRRDRADFIARLYSNEVTKILKAKHDELQQRIDESKDINEKTQLLKNILSLTRINCCTPTEVFNIIYNQFKSYTEAPEEARELSELIILNNMKGIEKYSKEDREKAAKKKADYKTTEFKKILDNYMVLVEESSDLLSVLENVQIDYNSYIGTIIKNSEENNYNDIFSKEEGIKEGWMTNFREISNAETLSQKVRTVITTVPKLNSNGKYDKDDLGNVRFLNSDYVFATLMNKLKDMTHPKDMIPLLKEQAKTVVWVNQIINLLEKDEALFSQFYQNFRKDFTPFYIQKYQYDSEGNKKLVSISINKPEGIYYLLDAWRDNHVNGNVLDSEYSVYDNMGNLNITNAEKGFEWVETLIEGYNFLKDKKDFVKNDRYINTINLLLKMIGVNVEKDSVIKALSKNISNNRKDSIINFLSSLHIIYKGIPKKIAEVNSKNEDDKKIDLINTFSSAYSKIAKSLSIVTEDAIESSSSEVIDNKNKSFYSHTLPNYLGLTIKKLKNVSEDLDEYEEYLEKEFKQYDWFYKGDTWRNTWLELLAKDPKYREGLDHKVVLSSDKVSYSNWSSLDYIKTMLTEYWGVPENNSSGISWAWYHVPILSDSPSAEFIKFVKYGNNVLNKDGLKISFEEAIVEKLSNIVLQEYDRIMLVRARDSEYQKNNPNISLISNFDISRDSKGKIKSKGGAEFKFLPSLNNLKVTIDNEEDIKKAINFIKKEGKLDENGINKDLQDIENKLKNNETIEIPFLTKLSYLMIEKDGAKVSEFIKESLSEIMENDFENTYEQWSDMGLLEESNGKYLHLPFSSQSVYNKNIITSLELAKNYVNKTNENSKLSSDIDFLLNRLKNNQVYKDKFASEVFYNIKEFLKTVEISPSDLNKINTYLNINNSAKKALKEYFYNSTLATSQIIQITTTDLAFYKNMEDFQKRFKEIYAPSERMNTLATYKGVLVGKEVEKTIYLKDLEIRSTILDNIESILEERYNKGEISKIDKDNIVNKFKNTNVADGQAYRSLSSYKTILVMSGKWDDDMEQAFKNFKSGSWNIADFNMVWQTLKPFVYTQIGNTSGIEGSSNIKTPVQHKNSEFLLMAMHSLISSSLKKSDKLIAINEFMEKNSIDVIQFESAVKVGKQGVVDLNYKQPNLDKIIEGTNIKYTTININNTNYDIYNFEGKTWEATDSKKLYTVKGVLDSLLESGKITSEYYNTEISKWELKAKEDVLNTLQNVAFPNGIENPNIVHSIPYEDYGIQTATPEHIIDTIQLLGTQIRKLISADISNDNNFKIIVDGREFSKQEWLDLYNAINTENIIEAFVKVDKIFKDPKEIEKILLEEIKGNKRYGRDLIEACTLNSKGQFNIPLFDPIQSQSVQTLLNSIIKSRITKQQIKGGALIQVSDYGLTDELNIMFKDKNGKLISKESYKSKNKNSTDNDFKNYVKKALKNGNLSIAYFECYMPAYSRQFYEPLMKEGTHELDINKLPEDLRKAIGYRIPTEDKYSMAPLYIKGFLPQQNGSAIMLPADITTISGSDFDVDKLFIMLPEFNIRNVYNIKQAWKDFYSDENNQDIVNEINNAFEHTLDNFIKEQTKDWNENPDDDDIKDFTIELKNWLKTEEIKRYNFSDTAQDRFSEWFNENKNNYFINKEIKKIKYNYEKNPQDNNLKQRNNALIDLMWGVLTNSDTAPKILNPGGFDPEKVTSRIINILNSNTETELKKLLNIQSDASVIEKLLSLDLNTLSDIASKSAKIINPLSPITQIYFHQQNMTGNKLIGIYANHNANHALLQNSDIEIRREEKFDFSFTLNGKTLTSLHEIKNKEGDYISKNVAGFLAASVDNVKDPVLFWLNQNEFTANASMLLIRLGYTPMEVGLLMSQPIILEMTKAYFKESKLGKFKYDIVKDFLVKYQEKMGLTGTYSYANYKSNKYSIIDLAQNILDSKAIESNKELKQKYYGKQFAIGHLFDRILKNSDDLGELVQITRSDSDGGAAGPTIADSVKKLSRVHQFSEDLENGNTIFKQSSLLQTNIEIPENLNNKENVDIIRQKFLKSSIPYIQAFYTLGLEQTENFLSKYFPHYTEPFKFVISSIEDLSITNKLNVNTINNIYNDYFVYILSNTEFFKEKPSWGENYENSRDAYINHFPSHFEKLINENPDIAELDLIKKLKVVKSSNFNPLDLVVFKNAGKMTPILKERFSRDWSSLLYMKNPKAQILAFDLIKYNYYRNGLAFGPSTFSYLAPTFLRTIISGYIDTLYDTLKNEELPTNFPLQYIYNHLNNRQLVPEMSSNSTVKIIDDKGNIKDSFEITISENSSKEDRMFVRKIHKDKELGEEYTYHYFVTFKVGNKNIYYQCIKNENTASYSKIEPLGLDYNFIEYDNTKKVSDIQSVIKLDEKDLNNVDLESNSSIVESSNNSIEYLRSFSKENTKENTQKNENILKEFGINSDFNKYPNQQEENLLTPNINHKGADNNKVCGTSTLIL